MAGRLDILPMEIWRDIEGYEEYQVSNLGNVRSLKYEKERVLKPAKNKYGYLFVVLSKQGKLKAFYIHRLVAEAFIDNHQNLEQINHKSEIKTDNRVQNLEWCTNRYNANYGTRTERSAASRINHPKRSKQVLCVETGVIYPSAHQVERELGFCQQNISSACNGKLKQAYGYTWKYVS